MIYSSNLLTGAAEAEVCSWSSQSTPVCRQQEEHLNPLKQAHVTDKKNQSEIKVLEKVQVFLLLSNNAVVGGHWSSTHPALSPCSSGEPALEPQGREPLWYVLEL